jgi:hypothetical protein
MTSKSLVKSVTEDPELAADVLLFHNLLGNRLKDLARNRFVDKLELLEIAECFYPSSGIDKAMINSNMGNFYNTLAKAGYNESTIRSIGFLKDYQPTQE